MILLLTAAVAVAADCAADAARSPLSLFFTLFHSLSLSLTSVHFPLSIRPLIDRFVNGRFGRSFGRFGRLGV